ncbi:MAG: Peptidyl-tRNA hydrolase [Mycoplasmataceae bacterium]|nr:MAG: Peptidyl-tRNA hydrolase [Mycoplasmataceae bacterium]
MKIIVGLGNQGKEFEKTRHNVGFDVIENIAKDLLLENFKKMNNGVFVTGLWMGEKFILLKPQTFMNNSGECVSYFLNYFKIDKNDILIIYDDISMALGKIRFRKIGTSGGHNGIKSIISKLKSEKFDRLKIGIGHSKNIDLKDWVIGKFDEEEEKIMSKTNQEAVKNILDWISNKKG